MRTDRLRIAFVCDEYPPAPHGGIGTFVQTLARALVRAGHEARVIGVRRSAHDRAPDAELDEGVRVTRLPPAGRGAGWVRARAALARRLAAWSRRGEIDLIEVPDWEGWAAGWPPLAAPVVVRLQGTATYFAAELGTPVRPLVRWLEGRGLARADRVCATSRYVGDRTTALFPSVTPAAVLYNAIPLPADTPFAGRARDRVVFAGTLTLKKGVISLARAWPRVRARCPAATLDLYGGDTRTGSGSVAAMIESLLPAETRASVRLHGRVPRAAVAAALRGARVAVLPSYVEAFALAPLEAMGCGCPTIAGRRGAAPELGADGRQLLLADPDDPAEIADAVVRVLTDDALARQLAAEGRRRVAEAFDIEHAVGENVAFYRECLEQVREVRA